MSDEHYPLVFVVPIQLAFAWVPPFSRNFFFTNAASRSALLVYGEYYLLVPGCHPEEGPKHAFPWEIQNGLKSEMASKGGALTRTQENQG